MSGTCAAESSRVSTDSDERLAPEPDIERPNDISSLPHAPPASHVGAPPLSSGTPAKCSPHPPSPKLDGLGHGLDVSSLKSSGMLSLVTSRLGPPQNTAKPSSSSLSAEAAWWPAKPPRSPEVAATSSSDKVTFLLSFELAPSVDAAARHANERAFPR